jgi:SNF2 family DNA or RNA helicase
MFSFRQTLEKIERNFQKFSNCNKPKILIKLNMNITERLKGFQKVLAYAKMGKKDYQVAGVKWCLDNELTGNYFAGRKIRGGFIADEMGLGKTITMIGTIFCNFQMPTLVVVPVVLIQQWYNEILKTTGHRALIFHGTSKKELTREKLEKSPIVITSYGGITLNKKKMELTLLHEIQWHRVIFDEAHHLRNRKTGRFLGAKMLNAKIRWLVSGTPVQNKKDDFFALCNLLRIPSSFYAEPGNIAILRQKIILKRTKREVGIDVPDMKLQNSVVPWATEAEERFGANIHAHLSFSGTQLKENEDSLPFKNYQVIQLLTRAKQACILPAMVLKSLHENNIELGTSSKMDAVVNTIVERKDNGNGKLVFCHYKEEIDALVLCLKEGGIERVGSLDGRNSTAARKKLLSEKYDVLILQIQTGCEGLNLQENYSEIYFVTPHWNPSVEDQAVGRCHRIGQTKPVHVFRFEMKSFLPPLEKVEHHLEKVDDISFDNYVTLVQNKKRELVKEFIK